MRTIDLDAVRPVLGEFSLTVNEEKRTFQVWKPTLRQKFTYEAEMQAVSNRLAKMTDKEHRVKPDKLKEYEETLHAWLARRFQIFIPEFNREASEHLTDEQAERLFDLILERDESGEAPKEDSGEKKSRKGSRGGK